MTRHRLRARSRRRGRLLLSVAAMGATLTPFGLAGSTPASAHCLNNSGSYTATNDGFGRQYNLNGNTCNGDFQYTGRFEDLAVDGYRIRMRWKLTSAGAFSYSGISNGTGISYTWTYTDSDSTAYFNICETDSNGNLVGCSSQGTDVGH